MKQPVIDLNADDVRERLRLACEAAGGQAVWAGQADLSQSYVSDVIRGRREVTDRILAGLGLIRVVTYREALN